MPEATVIYPPQDVKAMEVALSEFIQAGLRLCEVWVNEAYDQTKYDRVFNTNLEEAMHVLMELIPPHQCSICGKRYDKEQAFLPTACPDCSRTVEWIASLDTLPRKALLSEVIQVVISLGPDR